MNKHCYRLIFSRTHGELRVVSELARSCSSEPGQHRGAGAPRLWVTVRRSVWLLGLALSGGQAIAGGIVADGGAANGQRPQVIATQNGLSQVNITAPNQAGLSHNRFTQFDVDRKGAILNNSATMTSTQLAGMVQGNPNLKPGSGAARVILNEVNSSSPSQLRGFLEVAGGRAQVIVANPAGILCNGCGTLNAGRMTLTTGKPQLDAGGRLTGYQVERGTVQIEGGGLNGDSRHDTGYVEILARAVNVNAAIHAKDDLLVVAGRNRISADGQEIFPLLTPDGTQPAVAIDMGQMGGMYSGQIRMIGTEAGVGVRNQGGHIQAGKTLSVSSAGRLVWQSAGQQEAVTQAGGDIALKAQESIEYRGKLHSGGTLTVDSHTGKLTQSGTLAAAGNVQLSAAGGIESSGHLLAGSDTDSKLIRSADLTLKTQGDIRASGSLLSKKEVSLTARQIDISHSQLAAGRASLNAKEGGVALRDTRIDSDRLVVRAAQKVDADRSQVKTGQWEVSAVSLSNQQGAWSQTQNALSTFTLSGELDNRGGTVEAQQLALSAGSVLNRQGHLLSLGSAAQRWQIAGELNNDGGELGSNGDLRLDTVRLSNRDGKLTSDAGLEINAAGDINNAGGSLVAGKLLALNAAGILDNRGGTLNGGPLQMQTQQLLNAGGAVISQGDLVLASHQDMSNEQGFLGAGGALSISTDGSWSNRDGTAQAGKLLSVMAKNIDNTGGKLLSGDRLTLNAADTLENRRGEIGGDTLSLTARQLNNAQGKVIVQRTLALNIAQGLDNGGGLLASGGELNLAAGQWSNRVGTVQGSRSVSINTQSADNDGGKVLSGQSLSLSAAGTLSNRDGEISGNDLTLSAGQLDNAAGRVLAAHDLSLSAQRSLTNGGGLLEAANRLTVETADWDNRQGIAQGGGAVNAVVGSLRNTAGRLQSGGGLSLTGSGDILNQGGILTAQQALSWQGGTTGGFNNDGGALQSGGDLILNGRYLSNRQQGTVLSRQALSLALTGEWDNRGGTLTAGGHTAVQAAALSNAQGTLNVLSSLDMQLTRTLDNGSGRIFSSLSQTLRAQEILNVRGWMGSQQGWRAVADAVDNREGSVQSQGDALLTAATLNNDGGAVQSAESLALRVAQDISNRAGKLSAGGGLSVAGRAAGTAAGSVDNRGGQLLAGDGLDVNARAVDNRQNGLLYAEKSLHLALSGTLDNREGRVQGGAVTLGAASLLNDGGAVDARQQLALRILETLSNASGAVRSNDAMQIDAGRIVNRQGVFSSQGQMMLTAGELDNADGRVISRGRGVYRLDTLNNQRGKLHGGDALELTAARIANQAGELVSTGDFTLNAVQLDNSGAGMISSQAALNVQSDRLVNRDDGLLLGTTQTRITARELDNTAGRLQSSGTLNLTGLAAVDNRRGRIIANGTLSLDGGSAAPVVNNQGGVVQSGDTLSLRTRTLDNQGGTVQSQKTLTLNVQQDYTQRSGDTLSSNTAVVMTVGGVLTNLGSWLLPGSLTLNSAHFTNPGTLVATALQLTTGTLSNRGRLEADRMTLNADSLSNVSAIMGDSIEVNARTLDNSGAAAVIAALETLDLHARERISNRDGALIYSADRLTLSSGDLIENRASYIEADGDITMTARRLDNLREGLEIEREAEKSDYKWHRYNYYWRAYHFTIMPDVTPLAPTTQRLTFRNDEAAKTNRYGTLLAIDTAGKRAQVRVKNNKGELTDLWVNYLALKSDADGSYAMTFYETRGTQQIANVPTPYHNTVWREYNSKPRIEQWDPQAHLDLASLLMVSDYSNLRERSVTGTVTRDKLIAEGTGARILSGGNMALHISDTLLNDASTITANGNLQIDGGGSVENKGYSVNERRQEYIVDHYDRDAKHWYPTFNTDQTTALTTVDGIITGNGSVTISGAKITNTTVNQAQISSAEAALKAAEAERAEWQNNSLGFTVEGGGRDQGLTPLTPGSQASQGENPGSLVAPSRPLLPAEVALTAKQHLAGVATSIPNNGLFRQQSGSSSPFLVVTDERFTSRTKFISSDYMLSRVGYDPAQAHKRLGDGFYEQKVVREQVLALTGRASVHGEDAMTQYQNLMNNGVKVAEAFHLVPGVALTPQQIAALQQDIVWLVSETVNTASGPQTVWVPKVYLAPDTLRLTGDGALIAGGDLQLSADSVQNAGNLFAEKALSVDAADFSHQGGDIRAGSIDVQAGNLSVSTNLQDALRQATMSAGNINLSGTDISLHGAKLDATEDLSLSARNSLDIGTAKSSHSGSVDVIAGVMGNRNINAAIENDDSRMAQVSGEWQNALGSQLSAGGNLSLTAGKDITLQGSQVKAGDQLGVKAGGDIRLLADTTTNSTHLDANSRTSSVSNDRREDRLTLSTLSGDKGVTLIAGDKLHAEGAQVDSTGGGIGVSAQDVTLKEVHQQTSALDSESHRGGKSKSSRLEDTARDAAIGSTLSGRDGVTIIAREGDIAITGSTLHSEKGGIALQAKNDVVLNSATERESDYVESHSSKKGFLKKTSTDRVQNDSVTREQGTLLSGDTVSISAGRDLTISGSAVAADGDVALKAGNNVSVVAATEQESHYLLEQKKKSGLMGSGGIGFTIGKQSTRHEIDEKGTTQSQSVSTIGSTQGSVSITAGDRLHIGGADLVAGKDLSLTGDSVQIDPGFDQRTRTETFESKQSGLTVALSGTAGSALNTAVTTANQARKEGDGRLSALQGTKAALSGVQAAQALEQDGLATDAADRYNAAAGLAKDDRNAAQGATNTVGISASYGSQSLKSETRSESSRSQGSTLTAGQNMAITATGKKGGAQSGDITVGGSALKAGGDLTLDAARDISLLSAQNTERTDGKNSSKGGNIGVGIGVGSGGYGISVSAGVNAGKGHENGNGLSHSETTLDAGNRVSLTSGRDTTLKGAQVSGEQITADVGRNLTLQSEQDSDRYDASQKDISAGGSFTFGSMTGSGYVSATQDKLHSNFDSVKEQTGLYAGSGGYDIRVGEHTQLDGAVIASTADRDKNSLDTGTLGWSDIDNRADFSAKHSGGSLSSGGPVGKDLLTNMSGGMLSGANNSGHDEGTTKAAVSDGSLTIRDTAKQQQDIAELNRDTEHANDGSISPIFNKEKEQKRLKEAQLIGEIGMQAMDVARTQGEINALKAGKAELEARGIKAPGKNATPEEQVAYDALLANTSAYKDTQGRWGTGGAIQQGFEAAVAALQGLAGGNIAQALSGASAPYLAEIIKLKAPDEASRVMAHAVLGAVVAQAGAGKGLSGAAGAVTSAMIGESIKKSLYGDIPVTQLSEEQKQTLVALGSLASGLAGGLASGDATGAMAGAQAGKNELSNNMVSMGMLSQMLAQETLNSAAMAEAGKGGANEQAALALTKKVKAGLDTACLQNAGCVLMAIVAAQNQAGPNGPSHTGGDQTAGPGLSNTGGNQLPEQGENHTGNNSGQTHVGPNNTGGNQTVEQSPSNTGNTGDVPDLPNYMESQGYEPNKGSVGNMGEFLKQSGFGNAIKDNTQKTNQQYQG